MDMYVEDKTSPGGLVDVSKLKRGIREYQTVISVGTSVRNVKEGDLVCINPDRYAVRKFSENSIKNDILENSVTKYNFNVVKIDNKDYLLLDEADVEFIVEEYE
jgi:co-chaperonin GroES (HSP10)